LLALLPSVLLPSRSLKILTVISLLRQRISFVRTFDNLSNQHPLSRLLAPHQTPTLIDC
jgi:hypothetical protein